MKTFRDQDIVTAFGLKGTVIKTNCEGLYPIQVYFDGDYTEWFTENGKSEPWHKESDLFLLERILKKVKKKLFIAIEDRINKDCTREAHSTSYAYVDGDFVLNMFNSTHQVVQVEIELEVIEE